MITEFAKFGLSNNKVGLSRQSRNRKRTHSGLGIVPFRSGGDLKCYVIAKRGGAYVGSGGTIVVSLFRAGSAGLGTYQSKVYVNGVLQGGTSSGSARSGLGSWVAAFNANTTNSLNSNLKAVLVTEANAAFSDSLAVGDGTTMSHGL